MSHKISLLLAALLGTGALAGIPFFSVHAAAPQESSSFRSLVPVLREYNVAAYGTRKNHRTTLGLEDPVSAECPFCGAATTDITRVCTTPDGFEEVFCSHYQYGTDILYHYVDLYQGVCHDCPSVGTLEGSVLEDQHFAFSQYRTLIFCEGRSHI